MTSAMITGNYKDTAPTVDICNDHWELQGHRHQQLTYAMITGNYKDTGTNR